MAAGLVLSVVAPVALGVLLLVGVGLDMRRHVDDSCRAHEEVDS